MNAFLFALALTIALVASPARASTKATRDLVHRLTCNQFFIRPPTVAEAPALQRWLKTEAEKVLGPVDASVRSSRDFGLGELWRRHRHARGRHRLDRLLVQPGGKVADLELDVNWPMALHKLIRPAKEREVMLALLGDGLRWNPDRGVPTEGEFVLLLIEHSRYARTAPCLHGGDPIPGVIARAVERLGRGPRGQVVTSHEGHMSRYHYVRLDLPDSAVDRLRATLWLMELLETEILRSPRNSDAC